MVGATRRQMARDLLLVGALALMTLHPAPARAACCLDSCPSPNIVACTSAGCPTDVVPNCPGQIVAESPDPSATCGAGAFTSCPTSEVGACADGVNNDAWVDSQTDCADPDCYPDPACCGAAGERCCQAFCIAPMLGDCDDPDLVCSGQGVCVACGGADEPCCLVADGGAAPEGVCAGALVCAGMSEAANGTCRAVAAAAPAMSPTALLAGGVLLALLGAWHLRRRATL